MFVGIKMKILQDLSFRVFKLLVGASVIVFIVCVGLAVLSVISYVGAGAGVFGIVCFVALSWIIGELMDKE